MEKNFHNITQVINFSIKDTSKVSASVRHIMVDGGNTYIEPTYANTIVLTFHREDRVCNSVQMLNMKEWHALKDGGVVDSEKAWEIVKSVSDWANERI